MSSLARPTPAEGGKVSRQSWEVTHDLDQLIGGGRCRAVVGNEDLGVRCHDDCGEDSLRPNRQVYMRHLLAISIS